MKNGASPTQSRVLALLLVALAAAPAGAIEWSHFETAVRGYPVLRDSTGRRIADGNFVQWNGKDGLHVQIAYAAAGGKRMEESVVLQQRPELAQRAWGWRETEHGTVVRMFNVDMVSGKADAAKLEDGTMRHWSETLDVEPGRTFAGFGFMMAVKAVRSALVKGKTVDLKAIGFNPSPKIVSVTLSYAGRDTVRMSGRSIAADHYVVHPHVPAIAKLFVKVPDAQIWLTPPPAGFLRYEGTLAEPSDPIVRIDLLPGGPSEAATPVATSGTRK
jgi:hypothetical protein